MPAAAGAAAGGAQGRRAAAEHPAPRAAAAPHCDGASESGGSWARRSPPTLSQAEFVQALRDAGASAGLHDVAAFRAFCRPFCRRRGRRRGAVSAGNAELALDPALFLRACWNWPEVEDPRHSTSHAEHYSAAREAGGRPLSYASGAEFGAQ